MKEGGSSVVTGGFILVLCAAAFFVIKNFLPGLAGFFLVIMLFFVLCIGLLVAAVLFFAFKKPKEKEADIKEKEASRILEKGRQGVMEIRSKLMRIKDKDIRKQGEDICNLVNKILMEARKQKEEPAKIRQYLTYYLQTMLNIISGYERLESCDKLENDTKENVINCLQGIMEASQRQYDNLFEDDLLDLTVEMEVLTSMCKKDGLL